MRRKAQYSYFCSFCGKDQDQTNRLIAGPGHVYVCDQCIATFAGIEYTNNTEPVEQKKNVCSFCGKQQKQVKFLADGPKNVHICDECINLCQKILADESPNK